MVANLTDADGIFLVRLARQAVEANFEDGRIISPPDEIDPELLEPLGVFVTINSVRYEGKSLRGCIGFPYPTHPLAKAVIEAAIDAAFRDLRFPPLTAKELNNVVFEVSVLTNPELIEVKSPKDYPAQIKIGEDGLIIENGYCKGLLLPQVPVEWEWEEEEFLCQCCMKAGLPPDSWLLKGTKIYKFQSIIFEEKSPNGSIERKNLKKETK